MKTLVGKFGVGKLSKIEIDPFPLDYLFIL